MNKIIHQPFDLRYMDTLADGDSPLHRLDPRAKVVTTLVFIICVVSFDKYALSALMPFFLYPIVLISWGRLPAGYVVKKVLFVSPLALLVGIFNPLMDRHVLCQIGPIGISGGWLSFLSILVRFSLTVTAALVLVASTGFNAVCDSLIKFRVPKPFVTQLLFFHRYAFVLTDEAQRMARARSLRAFTSRGMGVPAFASFTGHLLLRALDRAQRVYLAMGCRGFDGEVHVLRTMKGGPSEFAFVIGWSALFIVFRFIDISLLMGVFLTGRG